MSFSRPTLKDVAQLSGVSEISVSRVMRNAPNISSRLREKVEAAAFELHYTPNKVAGALASNTTDLIGVVLPTLKQPEYIQILSGIESVLGQSKYRMMLGVTDFSAKRETKVVLDFLSWSPSGIIMVGEGHSDDTYELLKRSKSTLVEVLNDNSDPSEFGIGLSYQQATHDLVSHWTEKGFKKVAYVKIGDEQLIVDNFEDAFSKQLAAKNVSLVSHIKSDKPASTALAIELCAEVAKQNPEVEAIFLAGEGFAQDSSVYYAANLPKHISLASFCHCSDGRGHDASIDLLELPFERIGVNAAKVLLNGETTEGSILSKKVMLPAEFISFA